MWYYYLSIYKNVFNIPHSSLASHQVARSCSVVLLRRTRGWGRHVLHLISSENRHLPILPHTGSNGDAVKLEESENQVRIAWQSQEIKSRTSAQVH